MDKMLVMSALISFLITALALKAIIPLLRKLKLGQRILEIGPSWHMQKQGTPTMGGIAFLATAALVIIPYSFSDGKNDATLLLILAYCILSGLIGMLDDSRKLMKKQNEGLSAFSKFMLQLTLGCLFLILLRANGSIDTSVYIPFLRTRLDMGLLYYPFALLMLTGFSNAVNLTDGLDGLCGSVTALVMLFFSAVSLSLDERSVSLLSLSVLGICLGFLIYNLHPARVFMGDTGSLFLGATVGAVSLVSSKGTLVLLVGIIYLIETASVVIQVIGYKLTKKRIFLMAPIHHHLERKGMRESGITLLFSAVTLTMGVLCYILG